MKVSFQFDEAAFLAFNEYSTKHSPSLRRTRMLARLVMIPCMGIYILWAWLAGDNLVGPIITAIIVSVIWALLYPKFHDYQAKRFVRRVIREGSNRSVFGEYTLELTPEYLHSVFPGGEQKYLWTRVQKVANTNDHLFIYVTSTSAVIVPRASLVGASFDEVKAAVGEYFSKSIACQSGQA